MGLGGGRDWDDPERGGYGRWQKARQLRAKDGQLEAVGTEAGSWEKRAPSSGRGSLRRDPI